MYHITPIPSLTCPTLVGTVLLSRYSPLYLMSFCIHAHYVLMCTMVISGLEHSISLHFTHISFHTLSLIFLWSLGWYRCPIYVFCYLTITCSHHFDDFTSFLITILYCMKKKSQSPWKCKYCSSCKELWHFLKPFEIESCNSEVILQGTSLIVWGPGSWVGTWTLMSVVALFTIARKIWVK